MAKSDTRSNRAHRIQREFASAGDVAVSNGIVVDEPTKRHQPRYIAAVGNRSFTLSDAPWGDATIHIDMLTREGNN